MEGGGIFSFLRSRFYWRIVHQASGAATSNIAARKGARGVWERCLRAGQEILPCRDSPPRGVHAAGEGAEEAGICWWGGMRFLGDIACGTASRDSPTQRNAHGGRPGREGAAPRAVPKPGRRESQVGWSGPPHVFPVVGSQITYALDSACPSIESTQRGEGNRSQRGATRLFDYPRSSRRLPELLI